MSTDIVKYAFIAGEISPTLFGRTDLTKYDLAVAEGQNYFVDYRGGLSSRPGTEFVDFVKEDDKETRMYEFAFSPDLSNTYIVLFGNGYIRFIQDGAYVLSSSKSVSNISQANPGVVTSASHGLTNGTWVKLSNVGGMTSLNGRTFEVRGATTNTFQLYSVPEGNPFSTSSLPAYTSGGMILPIYEVASPYLAGDLPGLQVQQYRDLLRLTHADLPTRNLTRKDHDDWELSLETHSANLDGPTITSGSGHAPDAGSEELSAQVVFAVTQVDYNGDESLVGNLYRISNIVNYTVTEGYATITWTPEPTAKYYNVYRSTIASDANLYEGVELGYIGRANGSTFTDGNIIPDFTKQPPTRSRPFSPGRIERIEITDAGSGYTPFATSVSVTDPDGSGFVGQVVTDASGKIVNVIVLDPGEGYTSPTVSFSGTGTGATATAVVAPLTGTYPSLSAIYQQRQIYAASQEQPITVWGSRYKRFSNFDSSNFVLDNDSFEFDLDTKAIAPIRHMLVARGGLLLFTQNNIWLLNGGGTNQPLTPTNALADPQTYNGITTLPPLTVENDILYREGKGYATRLLSYSEISKSYGGEDKSILSNHLFGLGRDITRWAYQESPFKIVWCVREDGALLSFTVVKSEDVFAWTPNSTRGKFHDVVAIREGPTDRVYLTTERYINGRYTKFIERMSLREFVNVEDAWCVDAGLELGATSPSGTLTIFNTGDDWWAECSAESFSPADVGKFLRAGEGIFKVTAYNSLTKLTLLKYEEPIEQYFIPEREKRQTWPFTPGTWTLDAGTTTLSGLWHLEGETVSVLGDGNVFPNKVVTNGSITLEQPVTRAIVGLGYRCRAKSLPIIVPEAGIEAKRKRIVGLGLRIDRARGLKNGRSLDNLYEMRERTTEPMGRPTRLINGVKYQLISTGWDEEGQTYFVVDDPLPVTILSVVFDTEVGDDPD